MATDEVPTSHPGHRDGRDSTGNGIPQSARDRRSRHRHHRASERRRRDQQHAAQKRRNFKIPNLDQTARPRLHPRGAVAPRWHDTLGDQSGPEGVPGWRKCLGAPGELDAASRTDRKTPRHLQHAQARTAEDRKTKVPRRGPRSLRSRTCARNRARGVHKKRAARSSAAAAHRNRKRRGRMERTAANRPGHEAGRYRTNPNERLERSDERSKHSNRRNQKPKGRRHADWAPRLACPSSGAAAPRRRFR